MKILIVIKYVSPIAGGPVTSTLLTANALAKRNHDVTVLTTNHWFDSGFSTLFEHVKIIPITCDFYFSGFLFSPKIKSWLSEHIREYDIIHLQEYRTYQNAMVSTYAQKYQIPYILQARGSVLPFFEKTLFKRFFDKIWGEKILNGASKVFASTEIEKIQYKTMHIPDNKITIVPNGIDITSYSSLPPKGSFKSKYGVRQNEKVILSLGRIEKIKGIPLLIEAFALVVKEFSEIRLVIAGPFNDEEYRKELVEMVENHDLTEEVLFVGPVFGQDKISAYIDSDVYVLPSLYESFSNTVLEAWACETPVIVTEGCHISENIKDSGIIVNYDPKVLKDALILVLNNDEFAKRLGKSGRELIEKNFNLNVIIDNIEKAYYECYEENLLNKNKDNHLGQD